MGRWLFMLGGLIVWAVHFLGVYGIASVAEVIARADAAAALWAVAALTGLCLAADLALLARAVRRKTADDPLAAFSRSMAGLGAGLSAVAVLWQGLPAIVGH